MKNSVLAIFAVILGIPFIMSDINPVYAQETASQEFTLEEITVTAQKREQNVQNVPIAMSVATTEQLERQMVYTLQDLSRTTPALEFGDPTAGPGGAGSIRGIGTSSFGGGMEPSVGVVVDGVNQGARNIGNMFDVDRVEVLKGPQGTLFGNSASAGVINIVTASPDTTGFHGKIGVDVTSDGTLGSKFGRQQYQAMLNIPFNEKSAMRITGNGNFTKGLLKGVKPGQEDSERDNTDFRAKFIFKATEDFTINIIGDYSQRKTTGPNLFAPGEIFYNAATGAMYNPNNVAWITANCGNIMSPDNQYNCTDVKQQGKSSNWGISAQADWKIAGQDFVDIIAYKSNKGYPNGVSEMLGVSSPFMFEIIRTGGRDASKGNTFTNELRIAAPAEAKLIYVAGWYYTKSESKSGDDPGSTRIHQPTMPPGFFITLPATSLSNNSNANSAVFADVTYPLTEAFEISGGLRYSNYKITIDQRSLIGLAPLSTEYDKSYLSGRLVGQYSTGKDTMIYGSIARAAKAPVLQPPPISAPTNPPTIIKAEIPTSYELGTKTSFLNNKVALDFSVYYSKIKDWQGQVCFSDEQGALNCALRNIDGYETKGAEVEVFGQPMPGMKITTGYTLTIAEYPDGIFDSETRLSMTGKQVMYTPKSKFTFSGEYGKPVTENLYGFFTLDGVYKSERRQNTYLYPQSIFPACWILGSSIGIREMNDTWSLTLFGRNLTNQNETVALYPDKTQGLVMHIFNEQSFRQVGLSAAYRF